MVNNTSKILIIAGSDPSGGAGIQTDIKVAAKYKVYSSAVITSLTSQNTSTVSDIYTPDSDVLSSQLQSVLSDIKYDAIKIGMVAGANNIKVIIDNVTKYCINTPVITDPVMVSTSNDSLFCEDDLDSLKGLISNSYLVTPNLDEAEKLSGVDIKSIDDAINAAISIKKIGVDNVFLKMGHFQEGDKVQNILVDSDNEVIMVKNSKIKDLVVHGTGCALATAISCEVAQGKKLKDAVFSANDYIYNNIINSIKVGLGSSILTHF